MENNLICPLSGRKCLGKECAWFDSTYEACAMYAISDSLRSFTEGAYDGDLKFKTQED